LNNNISELKGIAMESYESTKSAAEKLAELLLRRIRDSKVVSGGFIEVLAHALNTISPAMTQSDGGYGACVINGACYNSFSAANCSGVGTYQGDGSICKSPERPRLRNE
jgi:hypothetical protein